MSQIKALKELLNAKIVKIKDLEIENRQLKKQLAKVSRQLIETRRESKIVHAKVQKLQQSIKQAKLKVYKAEKAGKISSEIAQEIQAKLPNENFFEGRFFYTGRMSEYGENTGVGVSLTEIIKEIATPEKPYMYYVNLVDAIIDRAGQILVQNMWRDRYQKKASGYKESWASFYQTDISLGYALFEAFEKFAEAVNINTDTFRAEREQFTDEQLIEFAQKA